MALNPTRSHPFPPQAQPSHIQEFPSLAGLVTKRLICMHTVGPSFSPGMPSQEAREVGGVTSDGSPGPQTVWKIAASSDKGDPFSGRTASTSLLVKYSRVRRAALVREELNERRTPCEPVAPSWLSGRGSALHSGGPGSVPGIPRHKDRVRGDRKETLESSRQGRE